MFSVGRMQIRHFTVFVKTAPSWQGTQTRFTKNTVCATPIKVNLVTDKSLDSPEKGMSTKCPKNVRITSKNRSEGLKTQFSDIF